MRTTDESREPDSRRDDIEADRRAVDEQLRAVMRDIQDVPSGTTEATELRREARRLREEHQRLTDEAGRIGGQMASAPHAVSDIEREMERRRIGLQILAVVVPWRDARHELDVAERDLFRVRAHALLNYLDVAVMPYPDLQDALAAARSELAWERPMTVSPHFH